MSTGARMTRQEALEDGLMALSSAPIKWKAMAEFYERHFSQMWRVCNPRVYDYGSGTYQSTKIPAIDMVTAVLKQTGFFRIPGNGAIYESFCANHLAKFGFPTYFLAPDLAVAIKQTRPPMAIDWTTMNFPMEAAVFMLPKGTLSHPEYGECAYIAYALLKAGERHTSVLTTKDYCLLNGGLILMVSCPFFHRDMMVFHYNFAADKIPTIELTDIESAMAGAEDDTISWLAGDSMMDARDSRFVAEAAHYLFGTLLLMLNKPEFVEPGVSRRKMTRNGVPIWSPNIIGRHYRLKREGMGVGDGTHASPRAHWRRGHWRDQVHGPKLSLRKQMWIEPVFVNPE
jgi:hypothetical protein